MPPRLPIAPVGPAGRRANDPSRLLPWLRNKSPFFKSISNEDAETLFRMAVLRSEPRGRVLAAQGERSRQLHVVIEGTLIMRVASKGVTRELFSYGSGEVAGLLALVDQLPAPYEIVAATACQIISIDAMDLGRHQAAYHPAAMAILRAFMPTIVEHLHELDLRAFKIAQRKNASLAGSGETFRRDDR